MPVRQHLDTLDTLPFEGGAVIHEEWLRAGLVMCLYRDGGGRMVDMVSGARPTADTGALVNSAWGPVTDYSGTANTQLAHRDAFATVDAMTLIVGAQVDAFTNYTHFVSKEGGTIENVSYEFRCGAASATDAQLALIRASAGGGYTQWSSSGAGSAAGRYVNAVRADGRDIGAGTTVTMWQNGVSLTVTRAPTGSGNATDSGAAVWVARRFDGATQLDGRIEFVFLFKQALPSHAVVALSRSPGLLFARPRAGMIGGAAGPITHTTTGALTADAATVTGTAAHLTLHTSTGALAASTASVTGAATHLTLHTTTGALVADAAVVAGAAAHTTPGVHAATGALTAQEAAVAGSATHLTLHTATGALEAGSATVAGLVQNGVVVAGPVVQGNLGWRVRKDKRDTDREELRQELMEALGEAIPTIAPTRLLAPSQGLPRLPPEVPTALRAALLRVRRPHPEVSVQLKDLRAAVVAAQEAAQARQVRRKRQQATLLLY